MSWTGRFRGSTVGLRAAAQSIRCRSVPRGSALVRQVNLQLLNDLHAFPCGSTLFPSSRALVTQSDGKDGSPVTKESMPKESTSASDIGNPHEEVAGTAKPVRSDSKQFSPSTKRHGQMSELNLNRGHVMYGDITDPHYLEAVVMDEIFKFDYLMPTRIYMAMKNCANTNLNTRCVLA